jgi:murein hydrolase activator
MWRQNFTGGMAKTRRLMPVLACCLVLAQPFSANPQDTPSSLATPETGEQPADGNPLESLTNQRNLTRQELDGLAKDLTLSKEKAQDLEVSIKTLEKSTQAMRAALVDSAAKRKDIERQIVAGEKTLGGYREREAVLRGSLRERRGILAEVLAALQRMGRNPPPALLVEPEDALSSVRSAILLGAVVPGIRHETEKLAGDLAELASLQKSITDERASMTGLLQSRLEEEKRTELLIEENRKRSADNALALEGERKRAQELASKATSLQGLISDLESQISSAQQSANAAREEEERRRNLSADEREKARLQAESGLPDKNRIAPAYAFSDLQNKLDLPVAGTILREYGDDDGTGHPANGIILATNPGMLVTAPADGWVVFAGAFRSYGQMVILNTGDGYHIVMAGMETMNVVSGQFVVAGEPLAVMGPKRTASATALALETDRPTLYIEFRKDGKPVDSRPWWSATDFGKARNDS